MNPNIDRMPVPEMNLPGNADGSNGYMGEIPNTNERGKFETSPSHESAGPKQSQPSLSIDPSSVAIPAAQAISPVGSSYSNPTILPAPIDDHELEKQYVAKAKLVIGQTRTDPYVQSKELNKVRAEFIKRKYGKDIKLSDR